MNPWKNLVLWILYFAVYSATYFYLKNSGLWVRYRWTGFMFGVAWAVIWSFYGRSYSDWWHRRLAVVLFVAGVGILLMFLMQTGGSTDALIGWTLVGLGAPQVFEHYKAWRLKMQNGISTP